MDIIIGHGRRLELASLPARWLGQFLDGLIYLAIWFAGFLVVYVTTLEAAGIVGFVVALLYLLFQDGLTNGQSWGKKILGTKVIDANTFAPCNFGQSFVRNLLLALLGIIDWVFIFGADKQRLGDKLAGTLVVKQDELPQGPEDPQATWNCPQCETMNSNDSFTCQQCGYRLR